MKTFNWILLGIFLISQIMGHVLCVSILIGSFISKKFFEKNRILQKIVQYSFIVCCFLNAADYFVHIFIVLFLLRDHFWIEMLTIMFSLMGMILYTLLFYASLIDIFVKNGCIEKIL